jgi:hypothetical protein
VSDETIPKSCPICASDTLVESNTDFRCETCGMLARSKPLFGFLGKGRYAISNLSDDYQIARQGLRGRLFAAAEFEVLAPHIYTDSELATFAQGDFKVLREPAGALASIIFEQLRERCLIQINGLRRAMGPLLEPGADHQPLDKVSRPGLRWQDKGNLFATEQRLVFPSDTFTFIRMDRKLVGVKAYRDAVAIQRRGEQQATYFVGCTAFQSALIAAYVVGKLPHLQPAEKAR